MIPPKHPIERECMTSLCRAFCGAFQNRCLGFTAQLVQLFAQSQSLFVHQRHVYLCMTGV